MLIQVESFDVTEQVANRQQPVIMLRREPVARGDGSRVVTASAQITNRDEWRILQHPLPPPQSGELAWSVDKMNAQVRIPLFPYLLPRTDLDILVQLGLQTASLAVGLAVQSFAVNKLVLATSNVFQRPDGKPGYQVWLGFAICLEK